MPISTSVSRKEWSVGECGSTAKGRGGGDGLLVDITEHEIAVYNRERHILT